jgi:hypothetical protein
MVLLPLGEEEKMYGELENKINDLTPSLSVDGEGD